MDGDFNIRRPPTPSSTLAFGRLHSLSPGILSWAKEAYLQSLSNSLEFKWGAWDKIVAKFGTALWRFKGWCHPGTDDRMVGSALPEKHVDSC